MFNLKKRRDDSMKIYDIIIEAVQQLSRGVIYVNNYGVEGGLVKFYKTFQVSCVFVVNINIILQEC